MYTNVYLLCFVQKKSRAQRVKDVKIFIEDLQSNHLQSFNYYRDNYRIVISITTNDALERPNQDVSEFNYYEG